MPTRKSVACKVRVISQIREKREKRENSLQNCSMEGNLERHFGKELKLALAATNRTDSEIISMIDRGKNYLLNAKNKDRPPRAWLGIQSLLEKEFPNITWPQADDWERAETNEKAPNQSREAAKQTQEETKLSEDNSLTTKRPSSHPWGGYSELLKRAGFLKPFNPALATDFWNSIEPSSRRAAILGHEAIVFHGSSLNPNRVDFGRVGKMLLDDASEVDNMDYAIAICSSPGGTSGYRERFECLHIDELKRRLVGKLMSYEQNSIVQEDQAKIWIHIYDPLTLPGASNNGQS